MRVDSTSLLTRTLWSGLQGKGAIEAAGHVTLMSQTSPTTHDRKKGSGSYLCAAHPRLCRSRLSSGGVTRHRASEL